MKQFRRCQRIVILSLLSISVLAPLLLVSLRLKNLGSIARPKEFVEDISTIKYRREDSRLEAIHQETGEGMREPELIVYKDKDLISSIDYGSSESDDVRDLGSSGNERDDTLLSEISTNGTSRVSEGVNEQSQQRRTSYAAEKKEIEYIPVDKDKQGVTAENKENARLTEHNKEVQQDRNIRSQSQSPRDEKIKEMKDQLIRAKAYLNFAPAGSNSHLVKELRLRIKEVERAIGDRSKDSDLSRSALQKMRHMELSLTKASQVYPDCSSMVAKLRAMTHTAEEQVRSQKKQASYLVHLASRTTPKGLHCLSMRLTAEYFSLKPKERRLPSEQKLRNLYDPKLHHYAVFSDNILACSVVVSSTISTALEPEKTVLHVVTDSLNFPAISMWFLLNPPGKATVRVQSIDDFKFLHTKYSAALKQESDGSKSVFKLNHLRFYLPELFPKLHKIILFDHDVVVQSDLTGLWKLDMERKVIGAVDICKKGDASCTWAFGVNVFDLKQWRRRKLTALYHQYVRLGPESMPFGWATFYNQTVPLDTKWHLRGLGYNPELARGDVERAAVIHYNGIMKPWLEIAIGRYKNYWAKHVKYDHPYLQQCNIHE